MFILTGFQPNQNTKCQINNNQIWPEAGRKCRSGTLRRAEKFENVANQKTMILFYPCF